MVEIIEKKGIVWALMNSNIRITNGNKWMYFDETAYEWVVCERGFGKKKNVELFRGLSIDEEKAVRVLCSE